MKNKKTTYILLVCTLFVWGSIIYRIVSYTKNDIPAYKNVVEEISIPCTDTLDFSLNLNYRDPFFETEKKTTREESKKKAYESIQEQKSESPVFKYKGLIRNRKKIYAMIEMDGLVETVSRYELVRGYKILSISTDSLIVEKYGQKFSIKAN